MMVDGAEHQALAVGTTYRTIDGIPFDAMAPIWHFHTAAGPVNLDFTNLPGATDGLRADIQRAFAALMLSTAPERAGNDLSRVRRLLAWVHRENEGRTVAELTAAHVLAFGDSLEKERRYALRMLKDALLAWAKTGVRGLSADLRQLLPKLRTERHMIGVAVRTMDPETGPLTDLEYEAVLAGLRAGFTQGRISPERYTMATLAIALALRPMQLALLKVRDFTPASGGGKPTLRIARLKQGKGIRPGTYTRIRDLGVEIARLVEIQCDAARQWAMKNSIEAAAAPLFPVKAGEVVDTVTQGLKGHISAKSASERLTYLYNSLDIRSERTGGRLRLFQTRLRRTFGTRAAAEGRSAAVIADLMDHSWEKCSLIYIETRPAMIERIDKAIALKMAPLAQAFAGTLAEESAVYARSVNLPTADALEILGGCGKAEVCWLRSPCGEIHFG